MWSMRLMKRGSAGLTFQFCYKFHGWNKGTSNGKKKVMKERRGMKRKRQKHLLITLKVDTLGNLSSLHSLCGSYWQPCVLPIQEPGMLINCSCDPWPSAPDRWVSRRQSSTGVFATCLPQEKAISQTLLTALPALGASTLFPPPLGSICFHKADYLGYCSHGCASCASVVHMWLPGRGPTACHRLGPPVHMCEEEWKWLGGRGIWVPT